MLGTSKDLWETDTRTFGASLAKYVGGNLAISQKLHLGVRARELIISDWLIKPSRNLGHKPDLDYLLYSYVLQISRCTGNAYRTTFAAFLRDENTVSYIANSIADGRSYQTLLKQHGSFLDVWRSTANAEHQLLKRVVARILARIKSTGLCEDFLQVWDARGTQGFKIKPTWASFIHEEADSAAFIAFTDRCWEFQDVNLTARCCKPSERTALRTTINLSKTSHFFRAQRDKLYQISSQSQHHSTFKLLEDATELPNSPQRVPKIGECHPTRGSIETSMKPVGRAEFPSRDIDLRSRLARRKKIQSLELRLQHSGQGSLLSSPHKNRRDQNRELESRSLSSNTQNNGERDRSARRLSDTTVPWLPSPIWLMNN